MAIARLSVKVGKVGKASAHAEYIDRDGRYEKQKLNDLEHAAYGNMPKWAVETPNLFWQAADLYERKNGSTYREFEIALPRELSPEQRIELIQDFIDQEIGTKYPYQLAIHNPKAMDGLEQPHAHLMFNERLQDGIERDPEHYFKRYNSKAPENGGAKKDNTGKDYKTRKNEIKELRQRWEDLSNQHLERAGLDTRIDMRSYKDQGIEQEPEKKLLPSQAKDPTIREALMQSRQANQLVQHYNLGDLSQELAEQLQVGISLAQDIEQGKAEVKANFEQFKAQAKPLTHEQKIKIANQKIAEAKQTTSEYKALIEKYRVQYVDSTVENELKKYQKEGAYIRSQIDELDQNKPMFFGKKDWEEKREKLVKEYRTIKHLHDHTKTEKKIQLLYDQHFGRETSIKHIEKNHPDFSQKYINSQELLQALEQLRQDQKQQERAQQKEKSKGKDFGMEM